MYHHHSQQQPGVTGSQPFANGARPPHHQPPPNQHQNHPASDMMSQVIGFQFPRPTQLPDELESALAIRGARDMDHRLIDHISRPNQHQNQSSGSGISQHGSYSSNPVALTSDNQPAHQQAVDWSSYQPPTKLFASPPPSATHQPQQQQGPQQQPQSSHPGTSITSWTTPVSDSPSPQARHPHGAGGDGQGLYTPESAGSILASFGLSNEDLEVLSHYPDDQLTPDTLPFILRDIQINKSGSQKTVASTSASSFSRTIREMPLPPSCSSPLSRSRSPEVPSLLTVTQTAGKVIDYGHASRTKDENNTRETFKREQLSSERTVKIFPTSPSSSSAPKADKPERRQVRLEQIESSKHGDRDYRRTSSDHRKSNRSPGREFPPSVKSRNLDRDYRHEGPKPKPSPETTNETSSRRSLSSSSGSKPRSSSKKLPTPAMISDFLGASSKVYPHTCSLCHIQCDQEKDWVDHINTVNHTAACRDLRNKYPDWKPNLPRSGQYGSRALWDPKDHSPSHSASRSLSYSPSPSPPHSRRRGGRHPHRPHERLHSSHHHPPYQHYIGGSSHSSLKRLHDDSAKFPSDASRRPSSHPKTGQSSKRGALHSSTRSVKSMLKPGIRTIKTASAKAADTSSKPPPAKKKKKMVTLTSQDSSFVDRLVYLTGIPKDASEQEVTDLVRSFGKINNVILMPCSKEDIEKGEGQKASVCMVKAEHAQALANSTNLYIKDQQIAASVAKKPDAGPSSDANNSKPGPGQDKGAAGEGSGGEAGQKSSDEKGIVLITGLPESDWSESDIIKLVQPFGTPCDIILARHIGKVLVSVPNMEIAQEVVKVNTFMPMKIKDSELKMLHLKQYIGLSTPVALYNLLMGSVHPLKSSVPVGWSSLLVISNVPNTPSGSSEVQRLVRRFGTVIKTLVLNSMVICEMATAAMAVSVYKRFQTFPCIIQNNPLFFSRKPDPKASTQTKVISAHLDAPEEMPANDKGNKTAADKEEIAHKEDSESPLEKKEKDSAEKDEEKSTEETVGEDEALGENRSKDGEDRKQGLADTVSESLAAPDVKPEADLETDVKETPAAVDSGEDNKDLRASEAGNDQTPAGEEIKPSGSDGKAASPEMAVPELPKVKYPENVTQEMVKALLVECRTRTNQPNNTAASTNREQGETQMETDQGEKTTEETKEMPKNHAEEEELKKQERERKEREARKQKERRERERRVWEKEKAKKEREREERVKREREKREEEKREWERKEKARRGRKRAYGEGSSGLRSSHRLEGSKQSSWKDERCSETESKTVEEDESDEFPFNMSDFVTVDEVGDVTDLPCSPSPTAPMETIEEDSPTSVRKDTPLEVCTEIGMSDATATLVKSSESISESVPVTVLTDETPDVLVSSNLTPDSVTTAVTSQSDLDSSQTNVQTPQPEAPETETSLTAAQDPTTEVQPFPTPIPDAEDSTSNNMAVEIGTAESEGNTKEDSGLNQSQEKEETPVVDKTEEHKKIQVEENKEMGAPAAETGKSSQSEHQTNTEKDSVREKLKTESPVSTAYSLAPFDPSSPVGMEFLVPKTGFFCKACNRFFSGTKEAEISHCKTLKHYDNLQKYLQTKKIVNVTTKPD
uniref:zinc finger protein 638-like isoform X2 n=1 Tax=Scatophagus argus TaxID=75038 RepID=UPI001ED82B68|nr:zinc finger protein 638-like isoform X2 [Scatophagus argus]